MALNRLVGFAHWIMVDRSSVADYDEERKKETVKVGEFQMPLHYPRYRKSDYETMEEWKLDLLLREYGLSYRGSLDDKRKFAMGAFLWPDQY